MKSNLYNLLTQEEKKKVYVKDFKSDQIIFHELDKCDYLGIVKKGRIKISSYSFNGNEITYKEIKDNDLFGNNLIFSSSPYYKGSVICTAPTSVYFVLKKDLLNILKNNTDFLEEYLRINAENYMALNDKIKVLSFESLEERLLYYLEINNKKITIDSITNLSSLLRVRRESLSRLITKLIKENKIEKNHNTLILK